MVKAHSVWLDLPTGTLLGNKGIVKSILNLGLVLVGQSVGIVFFSLSDKYQPSGTGGTCSPPATPHCLKMANGV